jgi:hypothetical protein
MFKALLALCIFSGWANNNFARANDNCCPEDRCGERVYDCGDPLNCGSINFWGRIGVAPTLWRDRGNFSALSCNALAIPGFGLDIVDFFKIPKFKKFFHIPFIVGGQIGYALTNNIEIFWEANYRRASHRNFTKSNVDIPNDTVNIIFQFDSPYRVFDTYVGARYYWDLCWCYPVAFFLGAKFGLVHHKSVCFNYLIASITCPIASGLSSTQNTPFFYSNTRPASGLNFGFDWCMGCGWSVMLMGEVVASCGPKSNGNILASATGNCSSLPSILPSNLIVGSIGTELFFPVTIGLKYSF